MCPFSKTAPESIVHLLVHYPYTIPFGRSSKIGLASAVLIFNIGKPQHGDLVA
jgi:hypothetical protein